MDSIPRAETLSAVAIADDDDLVGFLETGPVDLLISLGDLWDSTIEKAHARFRPKKTLAAK